MKNIGINNKGQLVLEPYESNKFLVIITGLFFVVPGFLLILFAVAFANLLLINNMIIVFFLIAVILIGAGLLIILKVERQIIVFDKEKNTVQITYINVLNKKKRTHQLSVHDIQELEVQRRWDHSAIASPWHVYDFYIRLKNDEGIISIGSDIDSKIKPNLWNNLSFSKIINSGNSIDDARVKAEIQMISDYLNIPFTIKEVIFQHAGGLRKI